MAHIQLEPSTAASQLCIEACLDCYDVCSQVEAHCLRVGGKHVGADHLQLLKDCAEVCRVTADFLLRSSDRSKLIAGVCADVANECALDCGSFKDDLEMVKCAEVCSAAANACRAF